MSQAATCPHSIPSLISQKRTSYPASALLTKLPVTHFPDKAAEAQSNGMSKPGLHSR